MIKEAHTSSTSGFFEKSSARYKNESKVTTFRVPLSSVSSNDPYPPTTMKVARNMKGCSKYSPKFSLNISKISREETNYKINRRLAGKPLETISTKND